MNRVMHNIIKKQILYPNKEGSGIVVENENSKSPFIASNNNSDKPININYDKMKPLKRIGSGVKKRNNIKLIID
jgi:hypothetical protein